MTKYEPRRDLASADLRARVKSLETGGLSLDTAIELAVEHVREDLTVALAPAPDYPPAG
jgi:hypothetical protein